MCVCVCVCVCTHTAFSLSVHLSMDSLFPYLGSSKQCCSEQRDCRYLSAFVFSFSEDKYSEVDLDGSYDISIFIF